MNKYARIIDGIVVEIIEPIEGITLEQRYSDDFVKTLIQCPDNVIEGWLYDGAKFTKPIIEEPDLSVVQQSLKQKIDQDAELERLKYITPGVGQSMTYQEKVNQAAAYSKAYAAHHTTPEKNPKPNDAEYLLLASGLGIDGDTLIEAAETVTFAYAQWQYVGAAIEGIRLQAKLAIDEAKNIEAAQAVYDGIEWPQA